MSASAYSYSLTNHKISPIFEAIIRKKVGDYFLYVTSLQVLSENKMYMSLLTIGHLPFTPNRSERRVVTLKE